MTEPSFATDAYCGIELDLQNGKVLKCDPLPLSKAIEYLGLIADAESGDVGALKEILETFPNAIGVELSVFDGLTPAEVIEAVYRFFAFRRSTTPAPTASASVQANNGRQP